MQKISLFLLLVSVMAVSSACSFRGKESITYYQGNMPRYKQGPDGRYYPVDAHGNYMPLDYGYRQDLQGFTAIVPGQGQQGGGQGQPILPGQIIRPRQVPQQGQGYYATPQQGAPGAPGANVPPRVGPGGSAPVYYPAPYGYQQQAIQGTPPQAPVYGTLPPRVPQLPTGYYGDNDESYEAITSAEQIDREVADDSRIVLPEHMKYQQPPPATPPQTAQGRPRLPDINKIYSNVVDDSDANYNIPQGYESQDIDNFNTFYSY